LSGTVSTHGALYPAIGETVHVTINGTTQDTTVSGSAGQFTLSFDTSALAFGGPYTIRYAYDGSATLAGSADETTALTVIAGMSPFQAWIAGLDWSGFTSPDLTASGDPDGDGMSNFQEYAFGLDPTKGSSVSPISAPLDKSSGTFSYTRRATPASTGITYKVFTSTDLLTWTQDTGASEGVVTAVGDVQTVPVTLSPALLAAPALFLRVEATQP